MQNAVTLNTDAATAKPARMADNGVTSLNDSTGLDNMKQLIQLRWIAVVGQIATIAVVYFGFKISLP
jgi:two-component system sensor histidine kinase RegB